MAYPGVTPTKFGRNQVPEPMKVDGRGVLFTGQTLKTTSWLSPLGILDQEDYAKQGIDVTQLIPGASPTDATGSCTCEAGSGSLAERLTAAGVDLASAKLTLAGKDYTLSTTDTVQSQKFALVLYHLVTDQTGDPSQEWPPTDCGSTGLYVCTELEHLKLIANHATGQDAGSAAQMLQTGSVIQGTPWFNAWMEPDSNGFVDGDGSIEDLAYAMNSGLAGGHETMQSGLLKVVQSETGAIDYQSTIVDCTNSWSKSWGDEGHFRLHLSTLNYLCAYGVADFKQFQVTH